MATFALRVWLPDRPGALGAVASRIGAVRGDVIGIEILERGAGRAVDELVVELPDESLVPLLLEEVSQVDGVDVEDIRAARAASHEPLETAVALVEATSVDALFAALAARARHDVDADDGEVVRFEHLVAVADDVAWAVLHRAGAALVLRRPGRPFHTRERRQLAALARIADGRWAELTSARRSQAVAQARALSTARRHPR